MATRTARPKPAKKKAPAAAPPRIQIENPQPVIDRGRYAAKRCVGDQVTVSATIFRDGHEVLRANVLAKGPKGRSAAAHPLHRIDAHIDGDTWQGTFPVDQMGPWEWTIEAWVDEFAGWTREIERKVAANQADLGGELSEGVVLLEQAAGRATRKADRAVIEQALAVLRSEDATQEAKVMAALDEKLHATIDRSPHKAERTELGSPQQLWVDRVRARFGSWYELFPRSFGGFKGVEQQIPRLAELGFDVLYLPPIHPIGEKNRKGRNNSLIAAPGDPGSPWAIGHHDFGGHDAIHPELGTEQDFRDLVATANAHGIEIALDLAIQCSADHPWLTEHPEWFMRRPDGTLKYAENPPKKYQDIYNVDWNCEDWQGLWEALHDVTRHWVDLGVRIFRVDNPHTKPLPFWEWLIGRIQKTDPDVLFLAEAFTRAAMMRTLAKLGFSQSYTYFTWKYGRHDLTEYVSELAHSEMGEYYRPNFFANTPDILTEQLAHGGPSAFASRAVLAATLSPTYGIYSGYEHFENVPVRPGSEEYLDSEKYEVKQRSLDGPLLPLLQRLNEIRRAHPALQRLRNIRFLETENDAIIAYAKRFGDDVVICVVNVDPHSGHSGVCVVPYDLGLPPAFRVRDLLSDEVFDWRLGHNFVRLDPPMRVAHVLAVESQVLHT